MYRLVDSDHPPEDRIARFQRRQVPSLLNHRAAAPSFQPGEALCAAVNVALTVGAPLLLTGEPGTGKTQVAHWLAHYFGASDQLYQLYQLDVRSTTTAEDLLYHFDHVAYFHAAHDPGAAKEGGKLDRRAFVVKGPLWKALETGQGAIVLLDEIDKAPRDFPNDLLGVLDQSRFYVREEERWIERREGAPPPFLVITSNSERRLPEPFLRRCIFHHIEFNEDLLRRAVAARRRELEGVGDDLVDAAIARLVELRARELRKRPATAEFLL